MAELKCSDGTVVQISKETEQELRIAFGPRSKPKPEPKLEFGDIVNYKSYENRKRRIVLYDSKGVLAVYSVSYKGKMYRQVAHISDYRHTGKNIFSDNLLNLS